MNSEKLNSLGQILIKYRKKLNFTQQDIAKKLCLKLDLICNIEKNILPNNIPWVFYRGYIYSYARLVKLPKKRIVVFLEKNKEQNYCISRHLVKKNINKNIFLNSIFFLLIKFIILLFSFYFFFRYFRNLI